MSRLVPDMAWPQIDPGKMRHLISIGSQAAAGQDSFGQENNTFAAVHSCYAAIETFSTGEQFQEGFVSQVVRLITIRWPGPGIRITAAMQVTHGTNVYYIQSVDNVDERNLIVRLKCIDIDQKQVGS